MTDKDYLEKARQTFEAMAPHEFHSVEFEQAPKIHRTEAWWGISFRVSAEYPIDYHVGVPNIPRGNEHEYNTNHISHKITVHTIEDCDTLASMLAEARRLLIEKGQ